jgi:hypothetical protein
MATNQESTKEVNALRRRRFFRQLLGAVVCVLVVVGLSTVISGAINFGAKLFDDSEEKAEYNLLLRNLVALDPLPFNSLSELSESEKNVLLNAAIWSSIGDLSSYETDEVGALYLPTVDIDKTVAALYGPDFKFTYQTFEDHGMTFTYVEEKQAYLLPITSAVDTYYPDVVSIKREGNTRRVTVAYIPLVPTGGEFSINATYEPAKYQDYIFTKSGDKYYLSAIVESETKATSSSSSASIQQAPDNADLFDSIVDGLLPDDTSSDVDTSTATVAEQTIEQAEPAA